jgi:preprotein translocase subunit SecA
VLQYSAPTIDGAAGAGAVQVEQAPALGIGAGRGPGGQSAGGRSGAAGRVGIGAAGAAARAGDRRPAPGQVVSSGAPSRNAPCPCGSGKKYKRCHGAPTNAT